MGGCFLGVPAPSGGPVGTFDHHEPDTGTAVTHGGRCCVAQTA